MADEAERKATKWFSDLVKAEAEIARLSSQLQEARGCPHGNDCACAISSRHEWLTAFSAERDKATALSSQLAGMREAILPLAESEHWRAVSANALFSVEHWKHNAGPEWPHEPDDDSFTAFENCKHSLCAALHAAQEPKEKTDAPR